MVEERGPVTAEPIVMYELEKLPDGTFKIGNSFCCGRKEAMNRIAALTAKHPNLPIGEMPPEWKGKLTGNVLNGE